MENIYLYGIPIALIIIILGYLLGMFYTKAKFSSQTSQLVADKNAKEQQLNYANAIIDELKEKITKIVLEREQLLVSNVEKESNLQNLQLKIEVSKKEMENLQEKFSLGFEHLANKILEEKSIKFTEQNQTNLKQILDPLNEKIKSFEKKIENTHKESIDYQAALRQQIIGLKELNIQMSQEAVNLTKALKGDSKTQGNWGELVLTRVLEKSGLEKGREYEVEKSVTVMADDEKGEKRYRPDVIIHLPDHKKMIIDAKVSLTHYEQYVNAEDEVQGEQYLNLHLQSIHRHIKQLSEKRYESLFDTDSPNFILLFIPIEPAFAVALNKDVELYNTAFDKNIVIVTPTTLLATLRTIDSMWDNAKQQKNAIEIATQAGKLYDKFEGFLKDLHNVGRKMDSAKNDYNAAMNKLKEGKGNLLTQVEKLKLMGAKAKKSIENHR